MAGVTGEQDLVLLALLLRSRGADEGGAEEEPEGEEETSHSGAVRSTGDPATGGVNIQVWAFHQKDCTFSRFLYAKSWQAFNRVKTWRSTIGLYDSLNALVVWASLVLLNGKESTMDSSSCRTPDFL